MLQSRNERKSGRIVIPAMSFVLVVAASLGTCARALDLEPLVPHPDSLTIRPAPVDMAAAQEAPEPGEDPNEVLVKRIHAIYFGYYKVDVVPPAIDMSAPMVPTPPGAVNQVSALAPALADPDSELAGACRAIISGPLTLAKLDALVNAATETAREYGWSMARAFTPEQELTSETLRIEIIPVWLEDVVVEGARWSRPASLSRPYRGEVGKIVNLRRLTAPHRLQSPHPFRQVTPSLRPGETDGSTQLKLTVEERRPFRVYGGYQTTHSRNSGVGRWTGGATMAAPWRTDDIWTIQYATDNKNDHLDSVSTVYQAYLPWRHTLTLTGLWSKSDSQSNAYIDQESKDYLLRVVYGIPLPEVWGWVSQIELGWEWRHSEAKSRFLGVIPLTDNTYVSAPFSLGWNGRRWDSLGVTSLSGELSYSPGRYLGNMSRRVYAQNRWDASPEWFTARAEIRRDWRLPWDFLASHRVWGQATPDRLVDAAQFYLGGNNSVRGYRESEVSGDYGVGMVHELLSPSLLKLAARSNPDAVWVRKGPEVRLAGFWDWGQVRRKGPLLAYEDRSVTMSGAGVGLRVWWGEYVTAKIDYAWRLRDTGNREDDRKNGFLHASVQIGF